MMDALVVVMNQATHSLKKRQKREGKVPSTGRSRPSFIGLDPAKAKS
jgi:hypothetical protein